MPSYEQYKKIDDLLSDVLNQRELLMDTCLDVVCQSQLSGSDWTEENIINSAGDVIEKIQTHKKYECINNRIDSYYNGEG